MGVGAGDTAETDEGAVSVKADFGGFSTRGQSAEIVGGGEEDGAGAVEEVGVGVRAGTDEFEDDSEGKVSEETVSLGCERVGLGGARGTSNGRFGAGAASVAVAAADEGEGLDGVL